MAAYNNTPVRIQIIKTLKEAPRISEKVKMQITFEFLHSWEYSNINWEYVQKNLEHCTKENSVA